MKRERREKGRWKRRRKGKKKQRRRSHQLFLNKAQNWTTPTKKRQRGHPRALLGRAYPPRLLHARGAPARLPPQGLQGRQSRLCRQNARVVWSEGPGEASCQARFGRRVRDRGHLEAAGAGVPGGAGGRDHALDGAGKRIKGKEKERVYFFFRFLTSFFLTFFSSLLFLFLSLSLYLISHPHATLRSRAPPSSPTPRASRTSPSA